MDAGDETGKAPFLPDERKWVWRPESQVLRNLGFAGSVRSGTRARVTSTDETRGSVLDADDVRRRALRRTIEGVLADADREYTLPAVTERYSRRNLPAGRFRAGDLIGHYRFQPDRVEHPKRRITTDYNHPDEDFESGHVVKQGCFSPRRPVVEGYFMDPRVVTCGIITAEMVECEIDRLAAEEGSDPPGRGPVRRRAAYRQSCPGRSA